MECCCLLLEVLDQSRKYTNLHKSKTGSVLVATDDN